MVDFPSDPTRRFSKWPSFQRHSQVQLDLMECWNFMDGWIFGSHDKYPVGEWYLRFLKKTHWIYYLDEFRSKGWIGGRILREILKGFLWKSFIAIAKFGTTTCWPTAGLKAQQLVTARYLMAWCKQLHFNFDNTKHMQIFSVSEVSRCFVWRKTSCSALEPRLSGSPGLHWQLQEARADGWPPWN